MKRFYRILLTILWLFLTTYLFPSFDIFYLMNVDKKWTFLDHLPPSSCKRSLWTTSYGKFTAFSPPDFQAFLRPWSKVEQGPMSDIVYWSSLMTLFFLPVSLNIRAQLYFYKAKNKVEFLLFLPHTNWLRIGCELIESNEDCYCRFCN